MANVHILISRSRNVDTKLLKFGRFGFFVSGMHCKPINWQYGFIYRLYVVHTYRHTQSTHTHQNNWKIQFAFCQRMHEQQISKLNLWCNARSSPFCACCICMCDCSVRAVFISFLLPVVCVSVCVCVCAVCWFVGPILLSIISLTSI